MATTTRRRLDAAVPSGATPAEPLPGRKTVRTTPAPKPAPVPTPQPDPRPAELVMLPVTAIVPSPDNPRRGLGDVVELAASIAGVGILEPLLVARPTPFAADVYPLVAGHRRLAAAKLAGLVEVPVIVRAMSDREQLEAMLVENLQRSDLSPLEEAAAFAKLTGELGVSQRALAQRIGCSQGHVSKRLALLELPEAAQAEIDSGGITVEDAVTLAKLELPELVTQVLTDFRRDGGSLRNRVENAINRQHCEREAEQLREQLRGEGFTVLVPAENKLGKEAALNQDGNYHLRGANGWGPDTLPFKPERHAGEPCHAAVVIPHHWSGGQPTALYVCTDPTRHDAGGASKLKARGKPGDKKTLEQLAAEKLLKDEEDARKARFAFGQAFLSNLAGSRTEAATAQVLAVFVQDGGWSTEKLAADLLELPATPPLIESLAAAAPLAAHLEPAERFQAYAAKGGPDLVRAALAMALAIGETHIRSFSRSALWDEGIPALHLRYLVSLGYQPTPWERAKLSSGAADPAAE